MAGTSWSEIPSNSHFSLRNIPFGIASTSSTGDAHAVTAIGENVLDLAIFSKHQGFSKYPDSQLAERFGDIFNKPYLNDFAALGRKIHVDVRNYLKDVFRSDTPFPEILKDNSTLQSLAIFPQSKVQMQIPMKIGDYTDFYAGLHHAVNVGVLFRGADNALQANYKHLPVGYHGRASSVVVSGTPIHRPQGQILPNPAAAEKVPIFSPCKKLDYEVEFGAFLCQSNPLGRPISIAEAEKHIFGYVVVNDWSARDIQAWEYIPLGPFGSKNLGTTITPWVVLIDALEPFMSKGLENDTPILDYMKETKEKTVPNVNLEVTLTTQSGATSFISRAASTNLLWSFPQMITHHSITGCNMNVGDLLASGTISGPDPGTEGSLIERTHNGKIKVTLEGEESRTFLEDGDTINIRGWCGEEKDGLIGFGDCKGQILPVYKSA